MAYLIVIRKQDLNVNERRECGYGKAKHNIYRINIQYINKDTDAKHVSQFI